MDSRVVLYDYAMSLVGLPYRWGGDDPVHGFDCSGLVLELLESQGAYTGGDTTAAGLHKFLAGHGVDAPGFGVLAFFGTPISHVAFCLNGQLMLEAGGGGAKTTSLEAAAAQNAYVRVRPIRQRKDCVGFRYPTYPWKG